MISSPPSQQAKVQLEKLLEGKRLTPAHRRIVQALIAHVSEIGYLSSVELAQLANVSQPSMTRFAAVLGFDGYAKMRRHFRALSTNETASAQPAKHGNKYLKAIEAEAANVAALASAFADLKQIESAGKLLAQSQPLVVLGLRASAGLAHQFSYFAAKIQPDVRTIVTGGSLTEDELEQARWAGASCLLAFLLPLYPREAIKALKYAKRLGMKTVVVSDATFRYHEDVADLVLTVNVNSNLVFDSYAAATTLRTILLDAMCDATPKAEERLEYWDRSSLNRKVFVR
jgi:DNA-binding MurR/RpiR family transcriptional regulator